MAISIEFACIIFEICILYILFSYLFEKKENPL